MSTIEIIGSPSDYLAAVEAHWQSLGLETDWLVGLSPVAFGTTLWAETIREEGHYILLGTLDGQGNPLIDMVVPDNVADLWRVPLTSVDTIEHSSSRGTLTLPAINGVAIVQAKTPGIQVGGFEKVLPDPSAPDAPVSLEWVQPTGAHDTYDIGMLRNHGGSLWISLIDANVWEPGVANWREVVAEGSLPAWVQPTGAGDAYTTDDEVTHNGEDWRSRRVVNVYEPGTSNSGWYQISNTPPPWVHVGNEGYPTPWTVTHNGKTWSNPSANNFWEPGVAIWVEV
jgi:hypothetical protein